MIFSDLRVDIAHLVDIAHSSEFSFSAVGQVIKKRLSSSKK